MAMGELLAFASGREVRTENVRPPIPYRGCDWAAYFDPEALGWVAYFDAENPESGGTGWGETEKMAIAKLLQNEGLFCTYCRKSPPQSCRIGGCPAGADM
jgi:hypothetical protein